MSRFTDTASVAYLAGHEHVDGDVYGDLCVKDAHLSVLVGVEPFGRAVCEQDGDLFVLGRSVDADLFHLSYH